MANEPSTTDLIQLKEIVDGVIFLKDGSLRGVVQVSAINFELRSSDEQAAILQQYAAFLNSVDFPVQMIVHSRRFDISEYLATVQTASDQLTNDLLKVQATEYMRFISELSSLSNIMSKNFYIALPMSVVAASESKGFFAGLKDTFKKKPAAKTGIPAEQIATYKNQLQQRADLIIGGLSGMGLRGHMLDQNELVKLFNDLYNPVVPVSQKANA
jgi:type IV secretory pathway VirB4 component